ncbi:hypothetical protein D3C81_1819510 [compost metagenome]
MAGGLLANTRASLIWLNALVARSIMANEVPVVASRSSQSFKRTNMRATFCPFPPGPEPTVEKTDMMLSFSWVK